MVKEEYVFGFLVVYLECPQAKFDAMIELPSRESGSPTVTNIVQKYEINHKIEAVS